MHRAGFVPFDRADLEHSITRRFEAVADVHPGRLAVVDRDRAWTYEALDRAANRVARALPRLHGPVLLLVEQGAGLVASILGVLKRGGMYVPLETGAPPALVAAVAAEAGAHLVLGGGDGPALAHVAVGSLPLLALDDILAARGDADRPGLEVPADSPAYIYYTSGTTGRPKGVADSHRNVLHNVMRYTNTLGIDADDRLTLLQAPGFSGAVSSLFGALLNGATVFPYDVRRLGGGGIGPWVVRERITIYHSVPALFRLAAAGAPAFPDLRIVRLEGDRMSRADWELFRLRCAPGSVLVNGLGSTECGLIRQYFIPHWLPVGEGIVPVGYPVDDVEVRVVDAAGRPVAAGRSGEIAVRSRYLAPGYYGRPDLTASAFTPDPGGRGTRVYRTGDLGRLHEDGCLEHLGRLDARVKLHGEWLDLARVEAVLLGAGGIREAAVRVHTDRAGESRLVAYLVPGGEAAPDPAALRSYLAARLPPPAVPSAFVTLRALPLTENGKVDAAALPAPSAVRPELGTTRVAPSTEIERAVAEIWADVLGIEEVGVHDSFFALGGDSLGMSRVQARLPQRFGVELGITELFDLPTIAAMARRLEAGAAPSDTPGRVRARAEGIAAATRRLASRRRDG